MRPSARALFMALVVIGVVWGATMPLSKYVVDAGYRHFGIIFWQLVVCTALLFAWLAMRGQGLPLTRAALLRYVFIALFGTVLPNAGSYIAQERLPAGIVSVCFALIPMLALPLAIAARLERPEPARLLGILAGLAGILLIVLPEASLPDRAALLFLPFAVGASLCYAVEATGLGRMGAGGLDPAQLLAGSSVVGLAVALPLAVLSGSWIVPGRGPVAVDAALVATAVVHVLCYAGYIWIVGKGGAIFAAQVSYLVTGAGVVWSMLLLGEVYSVWVWAAIAVVFLGLFLVQPRPRRDTLAEILVPHHGADNIAPDETQVS